jgi:hypothetical protein
MMLSQKNKILKKPFLTERTEKTGSIEGVLCEQRERAEVLFELLRDDQA